MVLVTYNIKEETINRFRKQNKGDMSKIVESFLDNYLEMGAKSSEDIIKLQKEIDTINEQINQLNAKKSSLYINIEEHKTAQEQIKQKKEQQDDKCVEWVNFMISDAKGQGKYTDLVYESEKAGYTDVRSYLEDKYYESLV